MRLLPALCALALLAWLGLALAGLALGPAAERIVLERILAPPSPQAWLGADQLGRSVALRLAAGASTSLAIAATVVLLSGLGGIALGVAAGWLGGWVERCFDRLCEVFLAFPGLLLAIALAAVMPPGAGGIVLALVAAGWVGFARLARVQTRAMRGREHVQAAAALGVRPRALLGRHVLPLIAAPLLVEASFAFAGAVVAEAGLSFLGLGVQAPAPSWGGMIRDGVRYMLVAPHLVLVPATGLALVVLAVNLLGDRAAAALDVRRGRPL